MQRYAKDKEGKPPHFLWNAKMRFGKTFASYQLAKEMRWKRVLVLTFKPAVQDAWQEDLEGHVDFKDWQFIGSGESFDKVDETKPYVWFASLQDVLGHTADGKVKERLEALRLTDWDCVILDEYHFGAWRDAAKDIYDAEVSEKAVLEGQANFSEETFPLSVDSFLYLSGTPFRSLANGEFTEDQLFSWTYGDEQSAKKEWKEYEGPNPYAELPPMIMMTYQIPDMLRRVAEDTDQNEFDINEFFAAEKIKGIHGEDYRFKHEGDVQKWLDLIRGQHLPFNTTMLGEDTVKPPIPFEDPRLLETLLHTLWYLPNVAACHAMKILLEKRNNSFYHDYKVVVAAGAGAGIGLKALPPVRDAITRAPVKAKSITLSCGKLTTGVTIPEWTGIFMLRNTTSPESYFQAAFRVQSPWTYKNLDPVEGEIKHILKPLCYVFDFAPNRALQLIVDYATELTADPKAPVQKKVEEFLNYLPVLCFDGYSMTQLEAGPLLDFVATGTASSALARKWQSSRLVDVGNESLARLIEHPEVIKRLEQFESFRNLREDITRTISTERSIKKLKAEKGDNLTAKEKKTVSDGEKEVKGFKKKLKENLLKFAARVPIFMYLTDYREETLAHVIENLEPELFKKVTNLEVADFRVLRDVGLFNSVNMDKAVYSFRRFEDASLHYADLDYTGEGDPNRVIAGFEDSYATHEDVVKSRVG
jgi:hypothetical protein